VRGNPVVDSVEFIEDMAVGDVVKCEDIGELAGRVDSSWCRSSIRYSLHCLIREWRRWANYRVLISKQSPFTLHSCRWTLKLTWRACRLRMNSRQKKQKVGDLEMKNHCALFNLQWQTEIINCLLTCLARKK
jgi:hypothetical protein